MMLPKDEVLQMLGTTRETIVEVLGEARRRKRKARTRIENLDPGTIPSDFATVEPTHQNFLQRNAVLVIHASVPTICGNISRKESGKIWVPLTESAPCGRSTEHATLDGSAASCQVIRRKLNEKMAERNWS